MIIDCATRIWTNPDQLGRDVAASLRRRTLERSSAMDASSPAHQRATACVGAAAVMGFRSDLLEARIPHELVADAVRRDPRRRFGIGGIDPMSEDALTDIDAAVAQGLVGITVSPLCQGFHPSHSQAWRVWERCADRRLPIFVSTIGVATARMMMEFGRPSAWDEIAREFPTLTIVIGGLGWPWVDETLLLAGKHSRVFADVSGFASRPWPLYAALQTASAQGVLEKLLFASGFPFDQPAQAIEAMYSLQAMSHGTHLPSLPRAAVRGIVERPSLHLLGIDLVAVPSGREADVDPAGGPDVDTFLSRSAIS